MCFDQSKSSLNIVQLIKLSINKDTSTYFYDAILHNKIQLKTQLQFHMRREEQKQPFQTIVYQYNYEDI